MLASQVRKCVLISICECADDRTTRHYSDAQASGRALFLQRAIEIGDLRLVREQLATQRGDSVVSLRNCHGETLLHTAVLHNQLSIAQTLLQYGASPSAEVPSHGVSESTLESVAPRSENFRYSRVLSAGEATPVHYGVCVAATAAAVLASYAMDT